MFGANSKKTLVVSTITVLLWLMMVGSVHGSGEAPMPEFDDDQDDATDMPTQSPTFAMMGEEPTAPDVVEDDGVTVVDETTFEPTQAPTEAPTAVAPTTIEVEPTSLAPTILAPTTLAPTTFAPTTLEPTAVEVEVVDTVAPTLVNATENDSGTGVDDADPEIDEGDIDGEEVDGNTGVDDATEIEEEDADEEDVDGVDGGGVDVPERNVTSLLQKAIAAVGGEEALTNLRYLQIMATGDTAIEFESHTPQDIVATSQYERNLTFDLENEYLRIDELYTPQFENFQFFPPALVTSLIQGQVGEQRGVKATVPNGTIPSVAVAAIIRQQLLHNPHFLLQYAMENSEVVEDGGKDENGNDILVVPDPNEVWRLNVFLSNETGLVRKIQTRESNALIRDRRLIIRYQNWNIVAENSELLFPRTVRLNNEAGDSLWIERRSAVMVPDSIPEEVFAFSGDGLPDMEVDEIGYAIGTKSHQLVTAFRQMGFEFNYRAPYGPTEELSEGLVYLFPTSHNSVAIKHNSGVILLEAPISNFQGALLYDLVTTELGDPITHLVQSHHHIDHSAGAREIMALAPDATFVVGFGIEDFYRDRVFDANSEIIPDSLSGLPPQDFVIESVELDGKIILLETPELLVEAYHTSLDPHADDTLITMIQVREEAVFVYQADIYNGGFGGTVTVGGPEAFFAALRDLGILSEECTSELPLTIISSHGTALTLEQALAELGGNGNDVGCS